LTGGNSTAINGVSKDTAFDTIVTVNQITFQVTAPSSSSGKSEFT
jgi:hypothetical protein